MLDQAILSQQFQALLQAQQRAVQLYGELSRQAQDPAVRKQLQELLREKSRHLELTQRLLEIMD